MCAKPTGFLEYSRKDFDKRPKGERLLDWQEVQTLQTPAELTQQAARCMDCGIPFCHAHGCPLGNLIPDFNDMAYRGHWREALALLHRTNNFPEITGRICPAPCETSCTLNLNQEPVTIRQLELAIVEKGWSEGWITPEPAAVKSGRRVAIIGSGPAGLAAAQQLARAGHEVTVFEQDERIGGILRYGIPDFKLEKQVLDRRLQQMAAEGVAFETGVTVGVDLALSYLQRSFHAVLLAGGARHPRDLAVPGRDLAGIHFAMDFLVRQNRLARPAAPGGQGAEISAAGKRVVVIGGGDTGADCVGTSLRQGAVAVTQFEILPKPPPTRSESTPWPEWPYVLRSSSSHEEGGERRWNITTHAFLGQDGRVNGIRCAEVEWVTAENGRRICRDRAGTEFVQPADLVLLAMGFTREGNSEVLKRFGVELDAAGNPKLGPDGMTSGRGVFVTGDLASGASLVVRAIAAGRRAAEGIHCFLGAL
jgi:NAD(P)H-dependent glutamate synthase small subunit